MNKFYYGKDGEGKLVRDKLDDVIRAEGHIVKSQKLKKAELVKAIMHKFLEEVNELSVAIDSDKRDEIIKELADLKSLFDSLIKVLGIPKNEVNGAEKKKSAEKGAFGQGTFIEYVELNPKGKDYEFWLKHFCGNSDRFKEEGGLK